MRCVRRRVSSPSRAFPRVDGNPSPIWLSPSPRPALPAQSAHETRAPEDRSATRGRNNSYTSSHAFVGITRRAPGDTRSSASRPWRAQVNHMGKAYRAPGNFETPRQAAEAYDALVRSLGLQHQRAVNFPTEAGEVGFDRASGRGGRGGRGGRSASADGQTSQAPRGRGRGRGRGLGRGRRGARGAGAAGNAPEGENDATDVSAATPARGQGRGRGRGRGGGRGGRAGGGWTPEAEAALLESRLAALVASREKGLIDDDELAAGKAKVLTHFATGDMHLMEP